MSGRGGMKRGSFRPWGRGQCPCRVKVCASQSIPSGRQRSCREEVGVMRDSAAPPSLAPESGPSVVSVVGERGAP